MNPIYTFNDTTIEIKIIDEEGNHYKKDIRNNDINKKLIENTVFKFDKCGSEIIIHYDVHVFQLRKMECKYSDYIEIKEQLENTEKELLLLKNKIDNIESLLQQQQIKLSNNKPVEDNNNIFPIKDLINYDFGKSIILECLVNDKQITKFKYKSTLVHIYNLINDKMKIIKNTKLNIIALKKIDNGFYYSDNLGISVQGAESNKCLLEIITQCIENKIKLYMEIKLIDNNIIEIKVIESIVYFRYV